jgi:hypothetical protein
VIRFLLYLAIIVGLAVCGATVKLGKHTFFGHVRAIWATEEVQDLKEGVEEKAGPTLDKVKRGANAAWDEATKDGSAGSGSGSGSAAGSSSAARPRAEREPAPQPEPATR